MLKKLWALTNRALTVFTILTLGAVIAVPWLQASIFDIELAAVAPWLAAGLLVCYLLQARAVWLLENSADGLKGRWEAVQDQVAQLEDLNLKLEYAVCWRGEKLKKVESLYESFRERVLEQEEQLRLLREELSQYVLSDDEIARQFKNFGGFAADLFTAWQTADSANRKSIREGFPALWIRGRQAAMAARKENA